MAERKTYGVDTSADAERTRRMLDRSYGQTAAAAKSIFETLAGGLGRPWKTADLVPGLRVMRRGAGWSSAILLNQCKTNKWTLGTQSFFTEVLSREKMVKRLNEEQWEVEP